MLLLPNVCGVDRCEECGFEYDLNEAEQAGAAIVDGVAQLAAVLQGSPDHLTRRPQPQTWSALEYACHVRDVLLVQRERVLAARRTDRPSFEPMGRDERVEHDGYAEQDPRDVSRQLTDAARLFANVLARLDPSDWDRTVMYNYPTRSARSLRWIAMHTLHEVHHHLLDASPRPRPTTLRVSSGSPYEASIGFSRALRAGERVLVSGTAPVWPDGSCRDDAGEQARRCFEIVGAALEDAGASLGDVVRTRMFITSASHADAVGAVHGELFAATRPAATMVVVAGLLDPRWKVEIEAEAIVRG